MIVVVDPKAIHYNARELGLIRRLHSAVPNKLRLACYLREHVRTDAKLRSHLLPAAQKRLEEVMGLASNALLGHLPAIWAPARASDPHGAGLMHAADKSVVDNGIDEVLVWVKDALLALETMAVDQTEHNIRVLLDALWSARDDTTRSGRRVLLRRLLRARASLCLRVLSLFSLSLGRARSLSLRAYMHTYHTYTHLPNPPKRTHITGARALLGDWLQAWRDATARRKTPSFMRMHSVLDKALKDVRRGHVVTGVGGGACVCARACEQRGPHGCAPWACIYACVCVCVRVCV